MKKKYIWVAAVIAIIGAGYFWYSRSNEETAGVEYITSTVEKGTLTTSISASGNVVVDQLATVDPTITGTVMNLSVKVGDSVEKGQHLFDIDNDDLGVSVSKASASLEQARNAVESAEISEDQAEEDYEAAKKKDKADNDAFSKEQLEILEDKIDVAEAAVVIAQKNYEASLADYQTKVADAAERKVAAPISGTVQEVNIKNGDDLSKISTSNNEKQSPIIIGDMVTLKASVAVNEVDIANVSIGQKAMMTFDAMDGLTVSGKVEKIDALGTETQGVVTYDVTIAFDTLDAKIKPQMSVTASIISDVKQDVVIVPSSAVKSESGSSYVEVMAGDSPVKRTVTTGASNNTETEITSGVNAGDKVVTQTIDPTTATTKSSSSGGNNANIRIPGITGGPGR